MGRYFGIFSRLTLSYDITFLVLTRLSFIGTLPRFEGGRCSFNPTKKCSYCINAEEELRYASAVSMMMFYHKIRDNISDGGVLKKMLMYILLPWATLKYKKAKKMYSEISEIVENCYRFGYGVGKWVYLTDAFDDIEKDLKDGSYNVFVNKYNLTSESYTDEIKRDITATINMSSGFFIETYENIEKKTLTPIMENIIYEGMHKSLHRIIKGENKDKKSKG